MTERDLEVLIQYGKADANKRLHLFLQFVHLRPAFQQIERKYSACQIRTQPSVKQHSEEECCQGRSLLMEACSELER